MSSIPANPGKNNSESEGEDELPSAEEVAGRLDRLWDKDQASIEADLHDLAGKSIGPYRLQRIIGRGAFGVVYLAKDNQLGKEVALKLPRPEVLLDEDRLRRFRGEASTAAMLDHPFIVPVYGAEFAAPSPYIVSAYCEGPDLGEWLSKQSNPVDAEMATRLIICLASAVEYAHQQGVLHRDLKPGNVLLEPRVPHPQSLDDFDPRLTDFGLAKLLQESMHDTRSSVMIGTPLYMAPEQLLDDVENETAATDVYAIGVLLFELIARQTPREGLGYVEGLDNLRSEEAPSLKTIRPDIPEPLNTIVAKCLERDPSQRYQSASSLADDLQRYADGDTIQAKPVGLRERFSRWTKQPERLAIAGYFAAWYHSMIITWLPFVFLVTLNLGLVLKENVPRYIFDVLLISLTSHAPKVWLGWRLTKGKRLSYWPSAIGCVLQLGIYVYSTLNESAVFEYQHATQLSKLNTFSILFLCSALELAFHLLAFPAWLRLYREGKMNRNKMRLPEKGLGE